MLPAHATSEVVLSSHPSWVVLQDMKAAVEGGESGVPKRNPHSFAIDAACDLLKEQEYAAVQRTLTETLPRLPVDAYRERIRIYMLLLTLPDHPINGTFQEDGLRVARHIFAHCDTFSPQYRLFAHMIFGAWRGEPTLDTERQEFFALRDAQYILAHPLSSRENRDCALTVIASQSPDHDQVRLCLEELFDGANAFAVTQACTMAPVAFHRATGLRYLERALDRVKEPPGFVADILRKKMAVILHILEEDTEAGVLDRKSLHTQLTMCHINLRMIPQALRQHAYSEYYLAYAAAYLDETELGLIHAHTAVAMAQQLGLTHLEKLACAVRDHLRSRAPYEGGTKEEH